MGYRGIEYSIKETIDLALLNVKDIEKNDVTVERATILKKQIITDESKIVIRDIPYTVIHKSLDGSKYFIVADERVEKILGKKAIDINEAEYFLPLPQFSKGKDIDLEIKK